MRKAKGSISSLHSLLQHTFGIVQHSLISALTSLQPKLCHPEENQRAFSTVPPSEFHLIMKIKGERDQKSYQEIWVFNSRDFHAVSE